MEVVFSKEFKKISMCPNYPILGFDFIAIPIEIRSLGMDDICDKWRHGESSVKVSSAISESVNSRFDDLGHLTITISNKDDSIQYSGNDIGFIYTDLVTGLKEIMCIVYEPDNPNKLNWITATSDDRYEYVNYMFEFNDILDGVKCDIHLKCNDRSIEHIMGSDVDKYTYCKSIDKTFIIKNSAKYIIDSNKISSSRNKYSFMINPAGMFNYGQKEITVTN